MDVDARREEADDPDRVSSSIVPGGEYSGVGAAAIPFRPTAKDRYRGAEFRPFPETEEVESLLLKVAGIPGHRGPEALLDACRRLGLVALSRAPGGDLGRETGLPALDCERLAAAFELGRRVETERWTIGDSVRTSAGVYRRMAPLLRGLKRETFYVLLLDGRHRLLTVERVSEGTLTTSLVHPREVFRSAIRASAAAVIVAHNHPSGDPEPSREDYEVTRRLAECGRLMGVPLLDHVVIGQGAHVSIRERMGF
jgi:DNA repair protein RadC